MAKAVTTKKAKKNMLLARAGVQQLPHIAQMAFGSGGVDADGNILEPDEEQTELKDEIHRKDIDGYEIVSDTKIQYICTLAEDELTGAQISEIALADENGDLIAIKNFMPKGKDADWEMTFRITDTM